MELTAYQKGFIKRANELGYDGVTLLKLAYPVGQPPANMRADIAEDDDFWENKAPSYQSQLNAAGTTSGSFSSGKFVGQSTPATTQRVVTQTIPKTTPQTTTDYSRFNNWWSNLSPDDQTTFNNMFAENGKFKSSSPDFQRFQAAHPRFFSGSDTLRDSMFEHMKASTQSGGNFTVPNSGPGWNFSGTALDHKNIK